MSGILTRPSGLIKPTLAVAYAAAVLADTPTAYFRNGEASGGTMVDSSGNGANGTYQNSPTLGSPGLIAGDADTSVTLVAASSQQMVSGTLSVKDFVHEVWIKNPGTGVLLRDNTSSTAGSYLIDLGALDATFISLRTSGTTVTTTTAHSVLRDGAKHHIVWRVQGTVQDLWIDGVKVHTGTITAAASRTASTGGWHFARNGSASNFINVNADEWAIYAALSDARVGVHYAAGH